MFEIVMGIDDFLIQLVKYCIFAESSSPNIFRVDISCIEILK